MGQCGDSALSRQLCVINIPGGEQGWESEASNKSEGLCEARAFQNGGFHISRRLDGQDGPKGCIPPNTVPIYSDHQLLLTLEKCYKFTCLPFDLSSALRVFTKLMKPIVGFLRQVGCRLIIYASGQSIDCTPR